MKLYLLKKKGCVRDSDPLGRRRACAAPLQERRGGAAGAHGAPCNIARPGPSASSGT